MQNNSKVNTILLVILIALVFGVVVLLLSRNKVGDQYGTDTIVTPSGNTQTKDNEGGPDYQSSDTTLGTQTFSGHVITYPLTFGVFTHSLTSSSKGDIGSWYRAENAEGSLYLAARSNGFVYGGSECWYQDISIAINGNIAPCRIPVDQTTTIYTKSGQIVYLINNTHIFSNLESQEQNYAQIAVYLTGINAYPQAVLYSTILTAEQFKTFIQSISIN